MSNPTQKQIALVVRLRNQAERFRFVGAELLREMTAEEMALLYNGIGPEWFPEEARAKIDEICADMQPPALLHDMLFALLPDEEAAFRFANKTLKTNGYKIADARHPWYCLDRYRIRGEARLMRSLCDRFGKAAWEAAHKDVKSLISIDRLTVLRVFAEDAMNTNA